jgi:site-specific DNA recombinase
MSPSHSRRRNRLYRYYVSQAVLKHGPEACPVRRVPAAEIEAAVIDQLRGMLRSPEFIVATWRAARSEIEGLSENAVRDALERLDPVWDELFPAEQSRIVQLLVARVDVSVDGIEIHLHTNGLTSTYRQLAAIALPQEAAA